MTSLFQDGGRDVISHRKLQCYHLVNGNEASIARIGYRPTVMGNCKK